MKNLKKIIFTVFTLFFGFYLNAMEQTIQKTPLKKTKIEEMQIEKKPKITFPEKQEKLIKVKTDIISKEEQKKQEHYPPEVRKKSIEKAEKETDYTANYLKNFSPMLEFHPEIYTENFLYDLEYLISHQLSNINSYFDFYEQKKKSMQKRYDEIVQRLETETNGKIINKLEKEKKHLENLAKQISAEKREYQKQKNIYEPISKKIKNYLEKD